MVVAGTALQSGSLTGTVLGCHDFRLSQTALVARTFIADGFDWRTPLPVFGPESFVPFEFPLFEDAAAV